MSKLHPFMNRIGLYLILLLGGILSSSAQDTNVVTPETDRRAQAMAIVDSLQWQTGDIVVKEGLATIHLNQNFRYLNATDAEKVLVRLWGNPPGQNALGMIFPANIGPLDRNHWGIIVTYDEDGYVKDTDASTINYDDLLKKMKTEVHEANAERKSQGYAEIELIGWAAPPHYDKESHKMFWAKELSFSDSKVNTLNYNLRILGRRGVLVLNAVADINQFSDIDAKTPEILSMVDFNDGNRYADFNPVTDKVAEYGLAALVAGGVLAGAAKLGLFKLIWVGMIAFWKPIAIGVVAIGGAISKFWGNMTGNSRRDL